MGNEAKVNRYKPPAGRVFVHPTAETFQRILLDNDPCVTDVRSFKNDSVLVDLLGRAVSQSMHLQRLHLNFYPSIDSLELLRKLFMRLARNRSIQHLTIDQLRAGVDVIGILDPFFRLNHNLRCIEITRSDDIAKEIPSLVSAVQSSREWRLENLNLDGSKIGDKNVGDLIDAFTNSLGLCHLLEICLKSNLVGIIGCTAIGNLLKKLECNISILELDDNALDDKCINILVDAFITNNTLKQLTIEKQQFVTPIGWCVFSAYLSNSKCSFDTRGFREDLVDDAVLISLGNSLSINKKVKRVSIRHTHVSNVTRKAWVRHHWVGVCFQAA